jgi:hypothetical protein
MAQDKPTAGLVDVTPLVIDDLKGRTAEGIRKYGRPLQTFNGRFSLQDAYEEALDQVQYLKQAILEEEVCRRGLLLVSVEFEARCANCGKEFCGSHGQPATVFMSLSVQNPSPVRFWCDRACASGEAILYGA